MRKLLIYLSVMIFSMAAFVSMSSFKFVNESAPLSYDQKQPVTFHTTATGGEGNTFTGIVTATGGINAAGTYVMTVEFLGMALHCTLYLQFPNGTITIRMNCNMVTFNGRWQVLSGTGAYQNLKGNGSLIMPDDIHEVLTGHIKW